MALELKYLERIRINIYQVTLFLLVKHFISISDKPEIIAGDIGSIKQKDIKKVIQWIIINKETLLKFWLQEPIAFSTEDLTDQLINIY